MITDLICFSIDPANQTINSYVLASIQEQIHIYIQQTYLYSVQFHFPSKSHLHMQHSRSVKYTYDAVQTFSSRMQNISMESNNFPDLLTNNSIFYTTILFVLFRQQLTNFCSSYNTSRVFSNQVGYLYLAQKIVAVSYWNIVTI